MGRQKKRDKPADTINENRYMEWFEFIFNNNSTDSDLDYQLFEASDEEIVELIRQTCLRCGSDLENYSTSQIKEGFSRILIDEYVFSFKEADLHYSDIVSGLQAIQYLYRDLFNERCESVLSHLNEHTDNPLNGFCYMLWDITPLAYWPDDPNKKHYYSAVATVMEKALNLSNPACVESALHGLGHIHGEAKESVIQIIDTFLRKNHKKIRPELIHYASIARTGMIL